MDRRRLLPLALAAAAALALTGCAGAAATAPTAETGGDRLTVVTSTNVYAQLVDAVGGDLVAATPLISSAAQDPHEYAASASDQLTVQDADLIVVNGGGYDAFLDGLVEASGSTAPVIVAVESSHSWPGGEGDHAEPAETAEAEAHGEHDHVHVEGFNEHVWYDPHTMAHVVEAIRDGLTALRPGSADAFAAGAATVGGELEALEARLDGIQTAREGTAVLATEPVAGDLLAAAGLRDATPAGLAEAVEEGQDVAPATLLAALTTIESGEVRVLVANAQTGGSETTRLIEAATAKGIPVLEFTETVPDGQTYLQWMNQNVDRLAGALGA